MWGLRARQGHLLLRRIPVSKQIATNIHFSHEHGISAKVEIKCMLAALIIQLVVAVVVVVLCMRDGDGIARGEIRILATQALASATTALWATLVASGL